MIATARVQQVRFAALGITAAIALTCTQPSNAQSRSMATPQQIQQFTASCSTSRDGRYMSEHYGPAFTIDACVCFSYALTTPTVGDEYMTAPSDIARKIIEYRLFSNCTHGLYPPPVQPQQSYRPYTPAPSAPSGGMSCITSSSGSVTTCIPLR